MATLCATGALLVATSAAGVPSATVPTRSSCLRPDGWTCRLRVGAAAHEPLLRGHGLLAAHSWRPDSLRVSPQESAPDPTGLLDTAREYLGVPYAWGGTGERGLDCSGFVNKVFARYGYDLPRTAREQIRVGVEIPTGKLKPADLVFFSTSPNGSRVAHVGIYVAPDEFIHASSGKGEVTYDRLSVGYYAARYVGARRFLALPPGRYSTADGGARSGLLFADPSEIDEAALARLRNDEAAPGGDEIGALIAQLTQHAQGDRPVQLTSGVTPTRLHHVGPRLISDDATRLGIRLGGLYAGDHPALAAAAEFSYFDHGNAFGAHVAVPFEIPLAGDSSAKQTLRSQWSDWHDYTKVLREISFGQRGSNLFVEASRTASATLGHGQIMRYYTPNLASSSLPSFGLVADCLSFSFVGRLEEGGLELFVDDVLRPEVVGTRIALRPGTMLGVKGQVLREADVGLTYAADVRAPYQMDAEGGFSRRVIHAAGLDAGIAPFVSRNLELRLYADVSSLLHRQGAGVGGAIGSLFRVEFGSPIPHVVLFRLEGRMSGATFIPSYFDATYRLSRRYVRMEDGPLEPMTRLGLLDSLQGAPARWGIYSELSYFFARQGSVGISYQDGDSISDVMPSQRYWSRSLMVFVDLREMYLPGSSRRVDFYCAYHLRNFRSLRGLLGLRKHNEYLFAALSIRLWRHVSLGGGIRKALEPTTALGRARLEGLVQVGVHYEL